MNPSTICRYERVTGQANLGSESTRNLELITAHVARHVGPVAQVIHETASQFVHVDILHVLPSAKSDFHVLVTSGMSDRAMNVPEGCDDCRFAELYLCRRHPGRLPHRISIMNAITGPSVCCRC